MDLKYIAVAFMVFGMAAAAFAIGNIFTSLINGIARNPEAEDRMSKYAYVGGGLAESIALFSLTVALIIILA